MQNRHSSVMLNRHHQETMAFEFTNSKTRDLEWHGIKSKRF